MRSPTPFLLLFLSLIIPTYQLTAGPVVIDDFNFTFTPSGNVSEISGDMIGGELDLRISQDLVGETEFSGGRLKVDSTFQPESLTIVYDGVDDIDGATPPYNYGLSHDLTGGGTNDRILVHIPVVVNDTTVTVYLTVYNDEDNYAGLEFRVTEPGVYERTFEDMRRRGRGNVDFTNIKRITFVVANIHQDETFHIDRIEAAGDLPPDPVANKVPTVKLKVRRTLRTKRSRLKLKGTAIDPENELAAVYAKDSRPRGKKRYRKAKGGARWNYTAPLKSGRNVIRFYAVDQDGTRSNTVRAVVIRKR